MPPLVEWFAEDGREGLRFACTMCGNCCSGPEGYVLVSDGEAAALAARLGLSVERFLEVYTVQTPEGRSLREVRSEKGLDCVFLDRQAIPGRAICGVYEDRPRQCRTWPFWPSVLRSRQTWERAKRTCPGMDRGVLVPLEQVRVLRDSFDI
jgi:Fe-S-cluster containining protein